MSCQWRVEQFAAPGAGVRGDAVEGKQPVLAGGVEEGPELLGGLYAPRLGSGLAGPFGPFDGVGRQDLVDDDGDAECLTQHGVDVLDGARVQAGAVPAAAGSQFAVELGEASRREQPGVSRAAWDRSSAAGVTGVSPSLGGSFARVLRT
jgi:hypothetical protein